MAGEMLQDERLLGVLAELASRFDIVLIDAPPLLAFGDTMTLSTRVDAMFAITRSCMNSPGSFRVATRSSSATS